MILSAAPFPYLCLVKDSRPKIKLNHTRACMHTHSTITQLTNNMHSPLATICCKLLLYVHISKVIFLAKPSNHKIK